MQDHQDRIVTALMEQLIETGPDGMAQVFTALFDLAMQIERERFLGAGRYQRGPERRGHANGFKPKKLDTPAGTLTLAVPKTRGTEEPFFPQALERGRRSSRAVMLAIAEMYVKGVSTRDAAKVMAEFGLESLSSTQVSRAAALLDDELEAWRTRPLGPVRYLVLDARYERQRDGGVVRDAAVLTAVGVGPDGRRRVLGVSAALSEAEVHWRAFLDGLLDRGLRAVEFVVSDDHPGLRAARQAVLPGATWQRCQFHTIRTQSTNRLGRRVVTRWRAVQRDDMADFQAVVMDDDALDDELQDDLPLGQGGFGHAFPNTLAEGRQLAHDLLGLGALAT